MINLIETPQRADASVHYKISEDVLTVTINKDIYTTTEVFDFTGLQEGKAEEVIAEVLPVNPIVNVEKIGDVINITVIRFYSFEEKGLFEYGEN